MKRRIRLLGQAVKTSPFHGGNTGSIPVGVILPDVAQFFKIDRVNRRQGRLITNQLHITHFADVAQLAEQLICNQQVIGSSPIVGFCLCK